MEDACSRRKCRIEEVLFIGNGRENSPGHLTVSVLFRHHQELKYDQLMMSNMDQNEMYRKFPDHTGYVCVYEVEYVQKSWTSTPSITFVSGLLS